MEKHHHKFPRPIARFIQLEGGQYGTVDMTALTAHKMEFQLGVDFVHFTRKQAEDLRDAVQMFINLGIERPPVRSGDDVVEVIDEEVTEHVREVIEEVPKRKRRARSL